MRFWLVRALSFRGSRSDFGAAAGLHPARSIWSSGIALHLLHCRCSRSARPGPRSPTDGIRGTALSRSAPYLSSGLILQSPRAAVLPSPRLRIHRRTEGLHRPWPLRASIPQASRMTDPLSHDRSASSSPAKRLVLLLAVAASAGYVCRVAITIVAPGIMHDFGLTQAQMGTVFSAFLLGYTLLPDSLGGTRRPRQSPPHLPHAMRRLHPVDGTHGVRWMARLRTGDVDSATLADSRHFRSDRRSHLSRFGPNHRRHRACGIAGASQQRRIGQRWRRVRPDPSAPYADHQPLRMARGSAGRRIAQRDRGNALVGFWAA